MNVCMRVPCFMDSAGNCSSCNPRITHPGFHSPLKALWEYTDEEIAREYHNRALKKLGDPRVGITMPVSNGERS